MGEIKFSQPTFPKKRFGPESNQAIWASREIEAMLVPYRRWIHSLVLFGSYAQSQANQYSDIDFLVLIKKGEQLQKLHKTFFDIRYRYRGKSNKLVEIQTVFFDEKAIRELFELSSPLAHAFRHGVVLLDDGWLKTLLSQPFPEWPTKQAALKAFTSSILWLYRLYVEQLKRKILSDHGPVGLCTQRGRCMGHYDGDLLARVISRMLYVTLPERGLLPLGKSDVVRMTVESYGTSAWRPVCLAYNILRKDRTLRFHEFQVLMPFAENLFRECIQICGPEHPEIVKALAPLNPNSIGGCCL